MNITATAVAVTLAVVVAVAFLFFGPNILRPFQSASTAGGEQATMATSSDSLGSSGAAQPQPGAPTAPAQLPTTLTAKDDVVGTGPAVKAGDRVTVEYVGTFANGTVFDASSKHAEFANGFPFVVGHGDVIKGWDQGLIGMQVGGTRTLIVPPDYGYGPNDYGPIPGNSTLIFQIKLLKIGQ